MNKLKDLFKNIIKALFVDLKKIILTKILNILQKVEEDIKTKID